MSLRLHAVYCDDIRFEQGNKTSLMGIYHSELIVDNLPCVLSKFCVDVSLMLPKDEGFESVIVKVFLDDHALLQTENLIDDTVRKQLKNPPKDLDMSQMIITMKVQAVLSPLPIQKPSILQCRATVDGKEVKSNGIRIRLNNGRDAAILHPRLKSVAGKADQPRPIKAKAKPKTRLQ